MPQDPPAPSLPAPVDWVLLARIVRPQGRRGEVLADIFTDFPQSFAQRKELFLRPPANSPAGQTNDLRAATVEANWPHQGRIVLKFAQIDSITQAETLRGFEVVTAREQRMPLEGDAVYVSDLLGMRVVNLSNGLVQEAGEIIDVEPEGIGPCMLVVRTPSGDEMLIPFVRAYLRTIDIAAKRMEMELPEGLLTLQSTAAKDGSGPEDSPTTEEGQE